MRWTMFAVLVAALALVGAGCGGGDDEGAGDTDTAVVTDTTTDETTTDETTTEDTETDTDTDTGGTGFDFDSEECQELVAAGAAFGQAFSSATTGADLSDEAETFSEFADNAPEEIRADMQTLANAYEEIVEALADIDIDPGATPTAEQVAALTQALASVDQAGVAEAGERISAWAQENCTTG
jgi:ABC-type glycerol-3-phosphate transport system substrate-binding protein